MSRCVAYSVLSVTADDALRYAMGEDVGYKENAVNFMRELVNMFCLKFSGYFTSL